MKKLTIYFLLIAMLLMTACGSREDIELKEKMYDAIFSNDVPISYMEIDEFENDAIEASRLPDSCQIKIQNLQTDLLNFLNKNFEINWSAADIEGYSTNVSKKVTGAKLDYKAFYYDGKMYFDTDFFNVDAFLEDETSRYVVSHELIHYFYKLNTGDGGFYLEDSSGKELGVYLEEAFVDELAYRFSINEGADSKNLSSLYKYNRTAIDVLSISCPDIFDYFLRKDISGFEKYLDTMIGKRIIVQGDAGKKFFYMIDCCQLKPTENNISRLVTFLVEMTPKSEADELECRLKSIVAIAEDYKNLMR